MRNHEVQRSIWNREYKKYQRYSLENWKLAYLKRIFGALELNRKDSLLDVGVSACPYIIIETARKGCHATGIDLSEEAIKKSAEFSRSALPKKQRHLASFKVCAAEKLPFKDNTFTKVCSIAVLEHIKDDKKAIEEIARVVRPNGKIIISVPNTYQRTPFFYRIYGRINDKKVGHLRHYRAEELIDEFRKRNFVLEDLIYHAHNVKILQKLLSFFIPSMNKKDSRLWWALEAIDEKQKNFPKSFAFSIVMKKEVAA
jgi:ubiquinone/menaquinone biosynthesis C-methylase UbiE